MMTALIETQVKPRVEYKPDPRDPLHFIPLVNQPGEFATLHKHELKIDMTYQRKLNPRVVARIANHWNWAAAGALLVSMRADGAGYFIFDGGHRWTAAKELSEIDEMPCLVFELASVTAEAIAFLSVNTERKSITALAAYKAELLTGAPRALLIDELAREAGRTIASPSDATTLSCVGTILRCRAIDEAALRRVWPVVVEVCRDHTLPGIILSALVHTERRMPFGQSLTDDRWRARLLRAGLLNIERDIRSTVALAGTRTDSSLAAGVAAAINRGIRVGKLRLRDRPRGEN